ncbi:MAG: 4'-phosphopantetheinyl transferase family protein [Marinilabiliaceae bacterium]
MPLLFENRETTSVRTAVWKITEREEELLQMLPKLNLSDSGFLNKISWQPRRLEWLASRILLHQLTDFYPDVCYNKKGQPEITGCNENISISHTREFAAVALSPSFVPGIDIERPSPRIGKVKDRFLNEHEKRFLTPAAENEQLGLIWCSKEAIFKKAGQKGLNFRENIIISPFTPEEKGQISALLMPGSEQETGLELNYLNRDDFYLVWTLH